MLALFGGADQVEENLIFTIWGYGLKKAYLGRVGGRAGTTRRRACAVPARGAAAQSPSGEQPSGGGEILAALGREKVVLKTV